MKNRNSIVNIFWIFFVIIMVILIAAITMGIVFSARYPVYGYGMMGAVPGMWFFGGIFMIIPLVLFFLFIYWIISATTHHYSGAYYDYTEKDSALDVLNTRYAKGEITSEQYQKMKEEIMKR